jgi:hypothetical protein
MSPVIIAVYPRPQFFHQLAGDYNIMELSGKRNDMLLFRPAMAIELENYIILNLI